MFDQDFWQEVWESIRKQKMRSLMTAFGVFWGLLILMFLIGAGMGFSGGIAGQMKAIPNNTVAYFTSPTTIAYGGFERGRSWNITDADFDAIENRFPGVIHDKGLVLNVPSTGQAQLVKAEQYSDMIMVAGTTENYHLFSPLRVVEGRFISKFDIRENRKVCVLGEQVAAKLFPGQKAVGKEVHLNGFTCQVVGVMRKTSPFIYIGPNESESLYLPISTAQLLYNRINEQNMALFILNDDYPSGDYLKQIGEVLRQRHAIAPNDETGLPEVDLKEVISQVVVMSDGINLLVWIVGLGTLLSGLIGIVNIMMVTVKERTQEIGVRRALGAQPTAIIRQIMCESLLLTLAAGVTGIIIGFWGLYTVSSQIATEEGSLFDNPHVPFVAAISALLILVLGGLIAGWIPARRALSIKAIEALREE
jgi:putative ABC transport system permease protein